MSNSPTETAVVVVHTLRHGFTLCGFPYQGSWLPCDWPAGHILTDEADHDNITCAGCRKVLGLRGGIQTREPIKMSYHRGEPYVWRDEVEMHLWSHLRDGQTNYASSVRIDLAIFDEIVVRRYADLIRDGRVPMALQGVARKNGGIDKFEEEMLVACRKPPET